MPNGTSSRRAPLPSKQETFEAGPNLQAWLFTIRRNLFFSARRTKQREALLLIDAEGLSYEEAAAALATKVGTIKSRVTRARTRLAELMGLLHEDGIAGSRGAPA